MSTPLGTIGELGLFIASPEVSTESAIAVEEKPIAGQAENPQAHVPTQIEELVPVAEEIKVNPEVQIVMDSVCSLLANLEDGNNRNYEALEHTRLVRGYMINAEVRKILPSKKTAEFKTVVEFLDFIHTMEIDYEKDIEGNLVKRIYRVRDNTVYIFKIGEPFRAYSPWLRKSAMSEKQLKLTTGYVIPGKEDDIRWYAWKQCRPLTNVCTFVVNDKLPVKWCAGEDPLYSPLVLPKDGWVKCSDDPFAKEVHYQAIKDSKNEHRQKDYPQGSGGTPFNGLCAIVKP